MNGPTPNLPLLRQVLTQIDTHPETWAQEHFGRRTPCGTTYCIGGHAVVLSGLEVEWIHDTDYIDTAYKEAFQVVGSHLVSDVAEDLLGLTLVEAVILFNAVNTRADIEEACLQIAARAGEPLWPEKEKS